MKKIPAAEVEEKDERRTQITDWGAPGKKIATAHGSMDHQAWCENERDRLNMGDETMPFVRIAHRKDGQICLSRKIEDGFDI